jgi:4-amino-4-deoxy-L-arabinose transferase-like glycosyltransferase
LNRSIRLDLMIVLAVAVVCQFGYFAFSDDYFYPDSATYIAPARNLIHGYGFSTDPDTPETFRTPGYPLFLVPFELFTQRPEPVVAAQHLLSCLLCLLLYLFARRETGSRGTALVASLLLAIDPLTIHYANKVLSENVFTLALFGAMVLTLRIARAAAPRLIEVVAAGLLIGAMVLIRPVAIAYDAAVALFFLMIWRGRRIRIIAIFAIASLLLPLGWAWRNYRATEVFTVASIAGQNMLLHRAAGVLAIGEPGDFSENLERHQIELESRAVRELREQYGGDPTELDHAVRAAWYSHDARPIILAHPVAYFWLTLRGVMVNLFDSDADSIVLVSRVPSSVVYLSGEALAFGEFVFACLGIAALWRRNRELSLLTALTVAYFVLLPAGGESEVRFRTPVMPAILVAAAAGAVSKQSAAENRE